MASRNPHSVSALILENTFLSLPRLVPSAIPALGPLSFLCHQKWDSASKIHLIPHTTPILMLSGVRDEVVPREHMKGLWELVQKREDSKKSENVSSDKEVASPSPAGSVPVVVIDPRNKSKFLEFSYGSHSEFPLLSLCATLGSRMLNAFR